MSFGPLFAHVADGGMGFEHLHFVGREWPEEIEWQPFGFFPVEPLVEVSGVEDARRSRVYPAQELVGFGGGDGKGLEPVSFV